MADTMTPEQRHRCMAAIKGKNTKPEMIVRRYLHSLGFRYGLHNRKLPGSPDIVLRKYKTVIFIHGCFWHGHEGCKYYRLPKTNIEFWEKKIERNKERDRAAVDMLERKGWRVITIWECELRKKETREKTLRHIFRQLMWTRQDGYRYDWDQPEIAVAAEAETCYGQQQC